MSEHWAKIGEAGALRGMRIMVWIYAHLGRHAFSIVLVPVMAFYYLRRGEARRASRDYLTRMCRHRPAALPRGPIWWLSFRHFMAFGHSLMQKYLAWTAELPSVHMEPAEEAELNEMVHQGIGCLLIGSHFGNLEYSRGISRRHPNLTINVLLHDKHASKFAELMRSAEPMSRMNLLQVTEIDLPLTLRLKEKVSRGEWVVIAGDRMPVNENARTISARFCGDDAPFPIGPYVLASVLQCPVYLLHCFRKDTEHHLVFEAFSQQVQLTRNDRAGELQDLAQRYATALERQVLRSPLQWFNFYDFWGDRQRPRSTA